MDTRQIINIPTALELIDAINVSFGDFLLKYFWILVAVYFFEVLYIITPKKHTSFTF